MENLRIRIQNIKAGISQKRIDPIKGFSKIEELKIALKMYEEKEMEIIRQIGRDIKTVFNSLK